MLRRGLVGVNLEAVLPPSAERLSSVELSHILSGWLCAQSTCLSTLLRHRAQGFWAGDGTQSDAASFSNMTDTVEMSTRRRLSHHRRRTDQHLQAAGVSLGRFPQKVVEFEIIQL